MPNYRVVVEQRNVFYEEAETAKEARRIALEDRLWGDDQSEGDTYDFEITVEEITETYPLKQYDVCVVAEVTSTISVAALDEDSAEEQAHELFVLAEAEITEQKSHEIKESTHD